MIRRAASHRLATWPLIALALCLVLPLTACGGARKPQTVRSDDGHATLLIPDGALPAGTKASDIHVRALSLNVPNVVAAYQLEPDGLRLAHPVTIEVHFDQVPDRALVAVHISSDGTMEPLTYQASAATVAADASGGFTYTTTVSHFSDVVLDRSDAVKMTVDPAPDVHVGESFVVRAHLGWSDIDMSWPASPTTPAQLQLVHWRAQGGIGNVSIDMGSWTNVISEVGLGSAERGASLQLFRDDPSGPVTGVAVNVKPGPDNPINPALGSVRFVCKAAGPWAMRLTGDVGYTGTATLGDGTETEWDADIQVFKVISGTCLPAPKTATPGGATSQGGATAGGSGNVGAGGGTATVAPTDGGSSGTTSSTTGAGEASPSSDATGAPVAGTETSQNCPTLPNGVRHGEYEYGPYRCDGNVIIRVMIWNGHEFPIYQFRKAPPDICAYDHYHSAHGIGYALDGTDMKEPGYPQEGCGFGVAGASAPSTLTQAQWDAWVKEHPAH